MPASDHQMFLGPDLVNAALAEWPESVLDNPFKLVVKLRNTARGFDPASVEAAGWHYLADIFYYQLSTADPRRPFSPMMVTTDGTSATPEMLPAGSLNWLSSLLPSISRSFAKARIGDVLWFRKRSYSAAKIALDSYFVAGQSLLSKEERYDGTEYITRACQIAALIGKLDSELQSKVMDAAEQALTANMLSVALDLVLALKSGKSIDPKRSLALLQSIHDKLADTGGIGWRRQHEEAAEIAEHLG